MPTPASSAHSSSSKPSRPISLPQIRPTRFRARATHQRQRAVGGDHRFAHPAVARVELAQDVVHHRAVVELHFGVFGHHAVVAGERGAKGAQALAAGIDRAQRFAEKQDGLKAFLHRCVRWRWWRPERYQARPHRRRNRGFYGQSAPSAGPTAAGGSGHPPACRPR